MVVRGVFLGLFFISSSFSYAMQDAMEPFLANFEPINRAFVVHWLTKTGDAREVAVIANIQDQEIISVARLENDVDETYHVCLSNGDTLKASLCCDGDSICSRVIGLKSGAVIELYLDERYFSKLKGYVQRQAQ